MDMSTITVDALLLTILTQLLFALLQVVHRHEMTLARRHDRLPPGTLVPVRIGTRPDRQRHAHHRARHDGHSQGA